MFGVVHDQSHLDGAGVRLHHGPHPVDDAGERLAGPGIHGEADLLPTAHSREVALEHVEHDPDEVEVADVEELRSGCDGFADRHIGRKHFACHRALYGKARREMLPVQRSRIHTEHTEALFRRLVRGARARPLCHRLGELGLRRRSARFQLAEARDPRQGDVAVRHPGVVGADGLSEGG